MTADDWLTANGKRPFYSDRQWYWGQEGRPGDEPADAEMLLPAEVYDLMDGHKTYPDCRCYDSRDDAVADFRQAFAKWQGRPQ